MRICAYPACRHSVNTDLCRMHRIPTSPKIAVQWMRSCHWLGSPRKVPPATFICSCHFNGGQGPSEGNKIPDSCQDDIPWIAVVEGRRGSLRNKNMGPRIRSKKKQTASQTANASGCPDRNILLSAPADPVTPKQAGLTAGEMAFSYLEKAVDEPAEMLPMTSTSQEETVYRPAQNCPIPRSLEEEAVDEPAEMLPMTSTSQEDAVYHPAQNCPITRSLEEEAVDDPAEMCPISNSGPSNPSEIPVSSIPLATTGQAVGESDVSQCVLKPYLDLAAALSGEENERDAPVQTTGDSAFRIPRPWGKGALPPNQTLDESGPGEKSGCRSSGASVKTDTNLQTDMPFLSYERFRHRGDDFKHLTGIDLASFEILFNLLGGDKVCSKLKYRYNQTTPKRLSETVHSPRGCLFLTLVRLRRNFKLRDMSLFFNLDEGQISRIFTAWIKLMSIKFKSMEDAIFVSVADQRTNTPDCYKPFPNLRCVVDAFEIFIQKPHDMEQQSNTFSSYKKRNTAKVLVGSSVYGGVSFVSAAMEGSASDRKIFTKSGIMRHLNRGEAVMADRGFDVEPELNEIGVDLIIPPYLGNRDAFTSRELMIQRSVAASRSHVETVIGRIENFKLIGETYPNTMLDILTDVVRVAANVVNFSDPFIRWDQKKKRFVADGSEKET